MPTRLTTANLSFWVSAPHTRLSRLGARQPTHDGPSGVSNGGF